MKLIWATRGRMWGFRFLRSGGFPDPLIPYETAFADLSGVAEGISRREDRVALRFTDPEGRTDRAGRIIPHDFVVFDELADQVRSVADGLAKVWPLVADDYARVWGLSEPPQPLD